MTGLMGRVEIIRRNTIKTCLEKSDDRSSSALLQIQIESAFMRVREFTIVLAVLILASAWGCRPTGGSHGTPEAPIVQPPEGWRIAHIQHRGDLIREVFAPKKKTYEQKMWLVQTRDPKILSKSQDELWSMHLPIFICQHKDRIVLKNDYADILFVEKDSMCYGRPYRLTITRIARGRSAVSAFVYRADLVDLPPDDQDFIIKTMTSAPLPTDAIAPGQGGSVANGSSPAPAANPTPAH
jgi:hypothetical protein